MLEISHPVDLRQIQKTRTTFRGYGGIAVTTNRASFGVVELDSVLDGSATAVEVVATQDGRGYIAEWHQGEPSGETVYVEKYSARGLEFHGWVDADSRRIVQAG